MWLQVDRWLSSRMFLWLISARAPVFLPGGLPGPLAGAERRMVALESAEGPASPLHQKKTLLTLVFILIKCR